MKGNEESIFYCTRCGARGIPIIRRSNHLREAGHLKKLYCLVCDCETNHVECKPWTKYDYEDFIFEFKYGNFTDEGTRKLPYGEFKQKMQKEGVYK